MGAMIARFLAAALLALAATYSEAGAQTPGRRASMVVELYTSQGCHQCPRANRLLGMFAREENVLALTFPVGIWDYLGWRDTFARPEFTARQRAYSETLHVRGRFTPQLVVDGANQISAADWDAARAMIEGARAAAAPANAPEVSIARVRSGRVRVTLGAGQTGANADVWLIAYDPGPLNVAIRGGLNNNRTVAHYNLVRSIEKLGAWNGASVWYERPRCTPNCAVIVQVTSGGPVLSAAYVER